MIFRRRSAKTPEFQDRPRAETRLVLETLEPRMLLSADPVSAHLGDAAALFPGAPDPEQTMADALEALTAPAKPAAEAEVDSGGVPLGLDALTQADPSVVDSRESTRELVFVDAGVTQPDRLIADLLGDGGERQVQVVMLDARRDGVAQMSETLAHYRELDAVHVLSHGTDGAVQLGASVLDRDSLERYADAIRGWSYSLGAQADLLLYGCNLAAGEDGRALVGDIAALTRADVAASEDLTGSAALGGDWQLEYTVGAVDVAAAIDPAPQRAWLGLLDAAALGSEFPVNSTIAGDQSVPLDLPRSVASDAAGNFVVVWESDGQDGDGLGVYGQRFDASGAAQGPEFPVNTETNKDQSNAAVAMNAGGGFIVVWQSDDQDGDGFGVYAQRYDAAGATDGPEFRINSTVAKDQLDPDVALRDDGSFVVTWSGENQDGDRLGVYAQRYDAAGVAQGGEVPVNSWTAKDQQWSSVAATPAGGFVVTWSSNAQDGDGYGVFAQRFDAAGDRLGGELRVNTETASDQQRSQVDVAADGSFVVVWESDGQDGNGLGIYAQRFFVDGSRDGGEFRVNETTNRDQMDAAVSMDTSGNFVVAWTSADQDGDGLGVYARQYDSLGAPIAGETQVATSTSGDQLSPSVSLGEAGRHVISWGGEGTTDDVGVYAQRFLGTPLPVIDLNGGGAGSGFTTSFTEDGGPVLVTDAAAATLGDPDGGNLRTLTVLISNLLDGADETLDADVSGTSIVKSYAAGVLTLTGPDSLANFQQVLRTITYDNASQAPTTVDRILRFVPKDLSGLDGASAYATVGVNAVNDAPVIAAPVSDQTDEDTTLVFSTGAGNAVTIADDARDAPIEVTLSVGEGDISLSFTVGDEFQVNTTTADEQLAPAVAVAADGRYVVAWQTKDPVKGWNVHAQLYAADGTALTGEVVVASDNEDETAPAVAIGDDGHFVVAWEFLDGNAAKGKDIYAQSFDATGTALTGEVRLNATTADPQSAPDIAMDADGNLVVAWQSDNQDGDKEGIVVRRFDATLGALSGEVVVNQTTGDAQTAPAIAMTDAGSFVIAWQSKGQDGGGEGVYARLFDAAASPLAGEFIVNVTTAGDQRAPDVAIDDGGAFVIAWQSDAQDGDQAGIFARRFDALGAAQGGEIAVNTTTAAAQIAPTVAMTGDGHFAVAWQSVGQDDADGKSGVYLREFDPAGAPLLPEMQVNTATADDQNAPAIAIRGGSDAVVVWRSDEQDGDKGGIYGQRFLRPGAITFGGGDGIADASMTFTGEVTDVNWALEGLTYTPRADFWGTDTLTVSVDDLGNTGSGGPLADGVSVTLTVNSVNDPIALTLPGAHAVDEDVPIVFSAANGNAITVTDDADDDGSDIELVLSVGQGTLTFATTAGLNFTGGADGDAAMTVRGTPAAIRMALDGLTYTPDAHYFGVDSLNVSVDDLGNTGSGGPYTQAGSVAITLTSVNDAPSHQLPSAPSTLENTPLVFSTGGGNAITVLDPDAGIDDIEMTLEVDRGTLTLSGIAGLVFSTGDGTADARMTFRGKVSEINAALDGLRFDPPAGYAGPASLRLVSNDLGNNGPSGIALGDDDVLLLDVIPDAVNDAPGNAVPGPQSTVEDSPLVFSAAGGNAISVNDDAGGNDIQVALSASGGVVTLSNTTGGEFQVNSVVTDEQREARMAMAPDGSFVVVWQSKNQDSSDFGVYAQRYTANGIPEGGEFRVNDTVASAQSAPEVAVAADGSFVVAWESNGQDGDKHGVFARRFDADGVPLGPEAQVNAFTGDEQLAPAIATDATGNFVVAWQSKNQDGDDWGIYAQRFDSAGVAQGAEFLVNTVIAKQQIAPAVAMDADGDFVIVWQSENQDGDKWGIYAQRYDAGGVAQGTEFRVNTITFKEQLAPAVAMDADGDFVVAWQSRDLDYPDDRYGIYMQRYDAAGTVLDGGQRLVNTTTPAQQTRPSLAMDSAGSFVVAWQGEKQDHPDGKAGVIAQRFAADGTVLGGEFLVNTNTAKAQTAPSVSMGDDGRFAVVWTSDDQDGDKDGVFAQRYRDLTALDFVTGDGDADATVTVRGTLDEINDALDGLVFTPDPDFFGAAQLTVTTDDRGFSGSGGAKTDVDVIDINVAPLNDAPGVAVPGAQTVAEGVPLVFSSAGGNAVTISDSDAGAGALRVAVDGDGGSVSLGSTASLTFLDGDGTDDAAMTFSGTLADINTALDGMTWRAPADFAGAGTLQVTVDDQGNSGAGVALTDAAGVSITVVADVVNDAPRIQVPDPQRTDEDKPIELSAVLGNGIAVSDDAALNPVQVTVTVSNGSVTLAHSAGPERLANSETVKEQEASSIALAPDGSYVVVWQSKDQDGSGFGIYGQRFDATGLALGGEFQVNATAAGQQSAPAVAVDATGRFVVAWMSDGQDGSGEGIFAQRFDADGGALGDEFLVNTDIAGDQSAPSVAVDASGAFVIAWQGSDGTGDGILMQRYDASGVAQGAETVVNATTAGNQLTPSVAMDGVGNFVVAWQGSDGGGKGVFAQRFDPAGSPQGPEFRVHTGTAGDQQLPSVAMNSTGTFVVAWQGKDANGDGVFARVFDSGGTPQTGELLANSTTAGEQRAPGVAINDAGDFAVVWQSNDGSGKGVFARLFAPDGSTLEGEFRLNTTNAADQTAAAVALTNDGVPVATWTSNNQDGDGTGVYAQRFLVDGALSYTTGDGVDDALIVLSGTLADVNAALDGLVFTPDTGFTGVAHIDIDVDDGGNSGGGPGLTDQDRVDIVVGKAPLVDLDADDSSGADGAGFQATFLAGAGAVPIADAIDALIEDPDDGNLLSVTITLTNPLDGGAEVLNANTGGTVITAVPSGNTLTLTGPDSLANFQQVLRTLTYENVAGKPTVGVRLIEVVANDGGTDGNIAVAAVNVTLPEADAPVEVTNAGSTANEGGIDPIVAAELEHADAQPAASVRYTVTGLPAFGQLELATAPGTPVASFTQADVDAGLVRYRHDGGETTADSFQFSVDDGLGNVLANRSFAITVAPVNDVPSAADDAYSVDEDTLLVSSNAWYDSGWSDRIRLTFDNATQGEPLVDVPVLVALDATRVDYASIRNGGQDLRFVDGDGALLDHEIERWDETGTSYVWVKVPQLDAGSAGDFIWMYYGNSGAVDGQNEAGVWSSDYRGVWHLDETSGQHVDSTGLTSGLSGVGGVNKNAVGIVGGADEFDGVNEYLWTNGSDGALQITGDVTVQVWTRLDNLPPPNGGGASDDVALLEFAGFGETASGNYLYSLLVQSDGQLQLGHESGSGNNHFQDMGVFLNTDRWYHLAAVRDTTVNTWTLYVDGVQAGTPYSYASEATGGSAGDLYMGWDNEYLDGKLDEPRVAASARSADWIAAQFAIQSDAFISYGTPEQLAGVLDNDGDADGDTLSATLLSGPSNAASFVLNADGSFSYTPDADFNGTDSFTYQAYDGTSPSLPATVTITVNPVNDAPGADIAGSAFAVSEDTTLSLHGGVLSISDVDAATGSVRVTLSVGEGTLTVSEGTNPVAVTSSGTSSVTLNGEVGDIQALFDGLNGATIGYDALAAPSASTMLTLAIDDQGNTGSGGSKSAQDTAVLNITARNDAPTLDATGTMVLDDVAEGNVNPIGNTVSEIIASAGGDAITDPDAGAVEGIAVTGVDDSNGTWEYSTDAGASWTSFVTSGVANGAADDTAAVLLAATDKVRFSPGASYTGSAGDLTFRAWDQTSGSNGDVGVDVSATGATSAFSDETETATLSVNGVVGVATAVPPAQLLDEDVALVFSSGNGNAITVSDGTGSDASLRVTLAVTNGTLTLSGTAGLTFVAGADGSATMTVVGLESAINGALQGLTYSPVGDWNGAESLLVETGLAAVPMAYYSFDNPLDTGNDDSPGGANDGVPVFTDPLVDLERGNVLEFDGTGDYVQVAGMFGEPASLTVGGWVNLDAGFLNDEFISLGDNVGVRLDDTGAGNGVTGFFFDGSGFRQTPSGSFVNATGWHHVAFTVDGAADEQILYLDGVELGRTSHTQSISYTLGVDTYLGRHGVTASRFLHGLLDDVRVYDEALPANAVAALAADSAVDNASVSITVAAVNDEPSFTTLGNQAVDEDSGPHTVAGFATPAAGGGADEAGQSFSYTVSNDNAGLFAVGPAIDASGQLTYTLNPNTAGTATVTVSVRDDGGTANGGDDTSPDQTFDIAVNPVNDEPSFTTLGNQSVNEDSGAHTVAGFATPAAGGGADESGQSFSYTVSNNNAALFAVAPAIDASGQLTYTLNPNFAGTATVTVSVSDDGGTANGGDDTSPDQTFDIAVNPVNDEPSFTTLGNQTVNEDSGPHTVAGFATPAAGGGVDESGQSFSYTVSNDNAALFAVAPAIDASGQLTYTLNPNVSGTATVTVSVSDDGGTANGGDDTSPDQTFDIAVNPVNDEPSFTTLGNQSVLENSGAHSVAGFATPAVGGGADESGQSFTFTMSNDNAALFAIAPAIDAAGTLTYTLNPAITGSATVTVSVSDDGGTANSGDDTSPDQTFNIVVATSNAAPSGDDVTHITPEDTAHVFAVGDFGFSDTDGHSLQAVRIASLPGVGALTHNGGAVSVGDEVSATDIAAGKLVFTPAADVNGAGHASFTFQVRDDGGTSGGGVDLDPTPNTIVIDVTAVNDEPSFTTLGNQSVDEDSGAHTVAGFATPAPGGGVDESGQSFSYTVSNDNAALFAVAPAIDASGQLTYTLNPNETGTATVTVSVSDDGGTANGGDDTSPGQTFNIVVNPINDEPSFTTLGNQTVNEDSGAHTVAGFATPAAGGGADESGQSFSYTVSNDNAALFAVGPAIDASGQLTYTLNPNVSGSATVTVSVSDDGGTANGGDDTSPDQTFDIVVNSVNDAPVADVLVAGYATAENTALPLHGTGLSVSDPDAGTSPVQATLAVGEGSLVVLPASTGVSVTGSGTTSVTLVGPVAAINSLLGGGGGASVSYIALNTPSASTSLTLTVDDLGNAGSGGSLTHSDAGTIAVTAENDAPTAEAGPAARVVDAASVFTLQGTGMTVGDVDAGGAAIRATLAVGEGVLTVSAGSTGVVVAGSGSGTVTLNGTVTAINDLLAGNGGALVRYTALASPSAATALTLTVDDLGNAGAGGPLTAGDSSNLLLATNPGSGPGPDPDPTPDPGPLPGPEPVPVPTPIPDPEPEPTPEPAPESLPSGGGDAAPQETSDAAAALLETGVEGVLAPGLDSEPPVSSDSGPDAPAQGIAGGGLELLRQLIAQREPDELLVLDDGNVRSLPGAELAILMEELDRVRDEVEGKSRTDDLLVASTATMASGLSVGYVAWLVRGGILVSSLLSSMPAWRLVDPLPVLGRLDDEDEEALSGEEDAGLDEILDDARERVMEER